MPRIVNILLLVVGLILVGTGLAMLQKHSGSPVIMALGVGLLVVTLVSDYRRDKRRKEQRLAESAKRISELTSAPWQPGQRLVVRGSISILIMMLMVGMICVTIVYVELTKESDTKLEYVLFGFLLLPIIIVGISRSLAGIRRPALELNVNGLVTPIHGRISWHDVTGIDLQQTSYRGYINSFLHFRVEQYRKTVKEVHWTERFLALIGLGAIKRGYFSILLKDKKEQPETIYAAARFLWKQATNSDYLWSPLLSDAANAAARNLASTMSQHADAVTLARRMSETPQKVLAEIEQMGKDISFVRQESRRNQFRVTWAVAIALILMLFSLAWPWLKRL
jgi:hypothetical protein